MVVSVSNFAENSQKVLDEVMDRGETVYLEKDGCTVAQITEQDTRELQQAIDSAAAVVGYAGCD